MIYSKLCLAKESNEKEPKKIKRKFRHVVRVCGLEMLVLDKQKSDPKKILHSCTVKMATKEHLYVLLPIDGKPSTGDVQR